MPAQALLFDDIYTNPADAGRRPAEVFVYGLLIQAHRLKDLGAPVALYCGNAHLGSNFEQALVHRFNEVLLDRIVIQSFRKQASLSYHVSQRFKGQVRVHGSRPVADEQGKMLHFPRLTRLYNEANLHTQPLPYQVMMHRGGCQ